MDMNKLMQQAQKMQEAMKESQEKLKDLEVQGSAGGDMVTVTMTGQYSVNNVAIDPSLLQEDKEVLEDLVAAATNAAIAKVQEAQQEAGPNMEGLNLPDGFKMPF